MKMMFLEAAGYIRRPGVLLAVFFTIFLNGIAEPVFRSISSQGFVLAADQTFGISLIIYACMYLIARNLYAEIKSTAVPILFADWAFFCGALALTTVPHPAFSWVAATVIAVREYLLSEGMTPRRRAAVLMLGVTFPMFWSRVVFSLLSSWILKLMRLSSPPRPIPNAWAMLSTCQTTTAIYG